MPGGEFHSGESGLPQRHRPIFLLMLLGLVFRRLAFSARPLRTSQRFRLQGGAAGHALQGSGESDFFTVWDGAFILLLHLYLGSILDRSPQLVLPGSAPCGEFIQVATAAASLCLGPPF